MANSREGSQGGLLVAVGGPVLASTAMGPIAVQSVAACDGGSQTGHIYCLS